jgi:pSer/pThr/pTyr-binding forkhead associated (FHA) protein
VNPEIVEDSIEQKDMNTTDNVHIGLFHELLNSKERLNLEFQGKKVTMQPAQRVLVIGRFEENDLVVDDRTVSRRHARIIFRNGKFVLIDQSTNGTFVSPEGGQEVCLMSEEEYPLSGSGLIGLGTLTSSDTAQLIHYDFQEA